MCYLPPALSEPGQFYLSTPYYVEKVKTGNIFQKKLKKLFDKA